MTLEINDRDTGSPKYQGYLIDWNDMNASVHSLACRCASVARSMKRNCFSLRFWGECWIGKTDKKQLVVTLQDPQWMSKDCVNSWSYEGECDHKHEKECVAKGGSEYIYFLNDLEKSENDINGGYSEWSSYSGCSAPCGLGLMERERTCTNPAPAGQGKDCSSLGPMSEEKPCKLQECPVNGGISEWTVFGPCSKSCGGGKSVRTRSCTRPSPSNGGSSCSESTQDLIDCATDPCPIDGNYGLWNDWETCSADCGDGFQIRQRECINPQPQYGGQNCDLIGLSQESRFCKVKECPINGGFGNWNDFSPCSKSCGDGVQTRSRKCNQPAPLYGGDDCDGDSVETKTCQIVDCPIDGSYGTWNSWGSCSEDCGTGVQTRQRECNSPEPQYGGKSCELIGTNQESRQCIIKECPINGRFGSWSAFSPCSKSCGDGVQTRTRKCNQPEPANGGKECEGSFTETNICKIVDCPIDGSYGTWNSWGSCSAECGSGVQTRQRECNNPKPQYGGKTCESFGTTQESRQCIIKECPINGNYGEWNSWGTCSVDCGTGVQTRQRECDRPKPQYGGKTCELIGSNQEIRNCKDKECPIDGMYGLWNSWGTCSADCGDGDQTRKRECINPRPQYGGKSCELIGNSQESRPCKVKECPINGRFENWSAFFPCSKSCGDGTQIRTRNCNQPAPANGGKDCEGESVETNTCKIVDCPIDGNYGTWNSWGTCSAECGTGVQIRQRECNSPQPQYGGKTCESIGTTQESRECKMKECPINGNYGVWNAWGTCSAECGTGVQTRQRECNSPKPQYGGKTCELIGSNQEIRNCKNKECPIDGMYGLWNSWGTCSADCGDGFQTRKRECINPQPRFGGKMCSLIGESQESRPCKVKECPINGGFGSWSAFSPCSKLCGDGTQTRSRKCNEPAPANGGKDCEGPSVETNKCKIVDCPIDGSYGAWNSWGTCSVDCGSGVQKRQRECNNPKPQYGGKSCELTGINEDIRECKIKECSINGKWSEWEPFSTCSQTCGSANRSKKRTCNNPKPEYGGQPCIGLDVITETCSFIPCPDHPHIGRLYWEVIGPIFA